MFTCISATTRDYYSNLTSGTTHNANPVKATPKYFLEFTYLKMSIFIYYIKKLRILFACVEIKITIEPFHQLLGQAKGLLQF